MRPRGADDGTVLVQLAAGSTIGRQRGASQAFDCASTTVCSGALRSHNTAPTQAVNTHPPPITPVGQRETVVKTIADLAESDDATAYIARMNKAARKT